VAGEDGRSALSNNLSGHFIRTGIGLFAPQNGRRRCNFIGVSRKIRR